MLTVLNVSSLASADVDALKMGSGVKFGMFFMSFMCYFCQCEHIKDGCCYSVNQPDSFGSGSLGVVPWGLFTGGEGEFLQWHSSATGWSCCTDSAPVGITSVSRCHLWSGGAAQSVWWTKQKNLMMFVAGVPKRSARRVAHWVTFGSSGKACV